MTTASGLGSVLHLPPGAVVIREGGTVAGAILGVRDAATGEPYLTRAELAGLIGRSVALQGQDVRQAGPGTRMPHPAHVAGQCAVVRLPRSRVPQVLIRASTYTAWLAERGVAQTQARRANMAVARAARRPPRVVPPRRRLPAWLHYVVASNGR